MRQADRFLVAGGLRRWRRPRPDKTGGSGSMPSTSGIGRQGEQRAPSITSDSEEPQAKLLTSQDLATL